jgi:hypothetical protein
VFESALPLQQAAQRLAAVVERSEFANWGVDCLVGRVTVERVEIARHRAGQRRPTRPIFRGRFSQAGDRIVLTGRFAYPLSTKILSVGLISVLAVFSTALLLFGFGALFVGSPAGPSRWVGFAGVTLGLGLIYALFKVVQPFDREDVPWISGMCSVQSVLPNRPSERPGMNPVRPASRVSAGRSTPLR